jgi:hypothetical protein
MCGSNALCCGSQSQDASKILVNVDLCRSLSINVGIPSITAALRWPLSEPVDNKRNFSILILFKW